MARRSAAGGGFIGKVAWAFFVASVGFAIIGDPTVGADKFRENLVHRADSFKGLVDGWTGDLRSGDWADGPTGAGIPKTAGDSVDVGLGKAPSRSEDKKVLSNLPVGTKGTNSGYDRDEWRHWVDIRPCWSVRDEVLYRDADKGTAVLVDKAGKRTSSLSSACGVAAGKWRDPYSKIVLTKPSDVDIDHIVPLAAAHRSGAANWSKAKKQKYANFLADPDHLRATAATFNREKSDQTPETWLPIDRSKHCWYARAWMRVKGDWNLTITRGERASLSDMLSTCK